MRISRTASILALTVALASCKIDFGAEDEEVGDIVVYGEDDAPAEIVAQGAITGFGSIYVNGRRFEVLDTTSVEFEGQNAVLGGQSLLKLGQIVRVEASQSGNGDAEANTIVFDVDLRGIASGFSPNANDPGLGTFSVLGQEVTVDAFTVLGEDFEDLNADSVIDFRDLDGTASPSADWFVVEVSGSVTLDGIIATRIDKIEERGGDVTIIGDEYDVKGFIDSVATDFTSFTMNAETFAIDGGTLFLDGLSASTLSEGDFIEAKVDRDGSGNYIAVEVERVETIESNPPAAGSGFEIEGLVQAVDITSNPNTILVNGVLLSLDDATLFQGFVGRRIFISGTIGADGRPDIDQFDVEPINNVAIVDEVASIDTAAGTIVTRLGVEITPTGDSRVRDLSSQDDTTLMTPAEFLTRINVGDEIRGRASIDTSQNTIWTQVQRVAGSDGTCSVMGPVSGRIANNQGFNVGDVTVSVGAFTSFYDDEGNATDIAGFFDELDVGDTVQLFSGQDTATCSNGAMTLSEAGTASLSADDNVVGNADDPIETTTVVGTPSEISDAGNVFMIGDQEISVLSGTVIGASVFSTAFGGPTTPNTDTAFAIADWPLSQLLLSNVSYAVEIDPSGQAISITIAA